MRPATLFVATFALWIVAKGRGGKYWALASTSDVGGVSSSAPNGASGGALANSPAGALPDIKGKGDELLKYFEDHL